MKKLLIQDNHNSRPLKIFMPKTIKSIRKLRFLDILWSNLGILITSYQFVAYKGLYWGHIWLYMNFAVNKDQYDIKMKRNGIWIWCLSISIKSRLFFVVCLTLVIYLWYSLYHINKPVTISTVIRFILYIIYCIWIIMSDLTVIKIIKRFWNPSEAEPLPENSWIRAIFEHPSGFWWTVYDFLWL